MGMCSLLQYSPRHGQKGGETDWSTRLLYSTQVLTEQNESNCNPPKLGFHIIQDFCMWGDAPLEMKVRCFELLLGPR